MATQVQRRKGTTAQHSTFTGAQAELTVDTDKNTVVVHDGATAGGFPLARDSAVVHLTGNETIAGTKTFSSTISGNISGNAGTVTNGVYTTGDQTIGGTKTFSSNPILNAGTANSVVYLNGSKVLTTGSALTFNGSTFTVGGTAQTGYKLQSYTASGNDGISILNGSNGSGDYAALSFVQGGNQKAVFYTNQEDLWAIAQGGAYIFGASGSERMRLTSTGLGIGTSSPTSRLTIGAGSFSAAGSQTTGMYTNGSNGLVVLTDAFSINSRTGTGFLSLDSSGNLGLGVTPSAWRSGEKAIDIAGGAAIAGVANEARIYANAFVDATPAFRYKATGSASFYSQSGGAHLWYTAPSGTAGNAISFTQAMTLDASGNLLVGATGRAAAERLTLQGSVGSAVYSMATDGAVQYFAGADGSTSTVFSGSRTNHAYLFYTNGAERARIDSSGNLLVGATSANEAGGATFNRSGSANFITWVNNSAVDGATHASFRTNGTQFGFIATTGSTTSFGTTSDYRLKENIQPMTGALEKVAALKPCTYKWKADGSEGEGFIAHELAEVVPQCVTGEKDAVDAEGKPVYQGIDTSFLVATLAAAIQEQQAMIQQLQAEVAALKGN